MKIFSTSVLLALASALVLSSAPAGAQEGKQDGKLTVIKNLPSTSVKNQAATGTCWCFATLSFLESELLRMGKGEHNLSEMFIVRNCYVQKAQRHVRMGGKMNFGQGGQAHDVMNVMRVKGMAPEEVYSGLIDGAKNHNHGELVTMLKGVLDGVIERKSGFKGRWMKVIEILLDFYLGAPPEHFEWRGRDWTPMEYMNKHLGLDPDDYIEISSYSHHPFDRPFNLEVPDNWSGDMYYNLPIEDVIAVMVHAIENGYSIAWDGDVSERGFQHRQATAKLAKGVAATQQARQATFDRFTTTDDHLMHITGLAKDAGGKHYFRTKNSWGPGSNKNGGYLNMSEDYVRLKTIAIMIHKDALPKSIAKRLGIRN